MLYVNRNDDLLIVTLNVVYIIRKLDRQFLPRETNRRCRLLLIQCRS